MPEQPTIYTTEPECCARVLESHPDKVRLAPDTPDSIPGNAQYYLLAKVLPHRQPLEIEIHWPQSTTTHLQGFQYSRNENFSTVLEKICFISPDRKNWKRSTNARPTETGAAIDLPPSSGPCWLSVGIPYFKEDLKELMSVLGSSDRCELKQIGKSRLGRPVHGIWIPPVEPDTCSGIFLIQAYQHHTEWAGLHAMDQLLRKLAAGSIESGNFAWSIVPCINVDSLFGGWREDLVHLEVDLPNGGNFNRDWKAFLHPEVRATRDFHRANAARFPVLHALDLHMGWSSRKSSGGGLTVFRQNQLPLETHVRERQFTREFFKRVPIENFPWEVSATDRANFAAWVWREFSAIGQTVEISRFRGLDEFHQPTEVSQAYYRNLGPCIARALADFYSRVQVESRI